MGFIPDDIVDEIRQRNDIYTIVSEYLRLKKQGRNYVGLCPFHNEKTPSFTVSPEKQMYYCFGCGAGGNVISFIMQIENLNFPEAVKFLADKAGIVIPDGKNSAAAQKLRQREKAYRLNELVKNFYHYILLNHDIAAGAREYLLKRGIDRATIEKFQLGFAPPGWDSLLGFLQKRGYSPDYLEAQGLVTKRSTGTGYYDRFRNRVMFPIWDHKNNVIGFGGRVLDDSLPKYLNSPETSVFNKSKNLYGINFAIPAIREQEHVVIVEGYMDVITCHQYGVSNVVASLGTAMTREQGKILARYAPNVYIAYDADTAGVAATLRGLEILQDAGCRVKVVTIPDGKDPDELIRKKGPESFTRLIREGSKSLIEYKLAKGMEKFDCNTIEGKIGIVGELIPNIIRIPSEIEREEQIKLISTTLGISSHSLWGEIKKYQQKFRKNMAKWDKITLERDNNTEFKAPKGTPKVTNPEQVIKKSARRQAEDNLIRLLITHQELYGRVKEELGVNFTDVPEYIVIINYLDEILASGIEFEPAAFIDKVADKELRQKLSALMMQEEPPGDPHSLIADYIKVIKDDDIKCRRETLLKQIEQAEQSKDMELRDKLLMEFSKLI
ncbi:DNA primase [Thermincola ferriacetica]